MSNFVVNNEAYLVVPLTRAYQLLSLGDRSKRSRQKDRQWLVDLLICIDEDRYLSLKDEPIPFLDSLALQELENMVRWCKKGKGGKTLYTRQRYVQLRLDESKHSYLKKKLAETNG